MNYIDQLASLEFNVSNPFDNSEFYFEELRPVLSTEHFEQLAIAVNTELYNMIHFREYASSIKYELMAERMSNPIHKEYFNQMSVDEKNHTDVLELIFKKMTGHTPNKDTGFILPKLKEIVDQASDVESTSLFFSSELKLIIIFGQIYKTCTNEDKKKFIGAFVAEESQHVNQMAELTIKMAATASDQDKEKAYNTFIKTITGENHFFLTTVKKVLASLNYDETVLNIVDNSSWTQNYLTKLLDRSYPVLKALKSDLDYNEFVSRRWT